MKKQSKRNEKGFYPINGELYPSVTTILRIINKPAIYFWYAKHGTSKMLQVLDELTKPLRTKIMSRLGWSMLDTPTKIMKRSGNIGSEVHHAIDKYLKTGAKTKLKGEAKNAFNAFLIWEKEVDLKPVDTEVTVWSDELRYAGTLDFVGYINGELCIADWKTSSGIYPENALQLSAYREAFEERSQKTFAVPLTTAKKMYLVRLDKKTGKPQIKIFEDSPDLFKTFLAAKQIWEWQHK